MLDNIKTLLGIDPEDTSLDTKLRLLISIVTSRLKILLGGIEPPGSMDHIIIEATIMRFNRIGSEGLSSHTVEGESLSFSNDDFAEFADEIQAFLDTQESSTRGRLTFL